MKPEALVKNLFIKKKKTLGIAESCTGGLISHTLTNIPGASGYFKLGVIAYTNEAKISLLGIPAKIIHKYGAVSKQVVSLMAKNITQVAQSSVGLAVTGIAGPTGGTKQKSVGTVFITCTNKKKLITKKFIFKGNRLSVKKQVLNQALKILQKII